MEIQINIENKLFNTVFYFVQECEGMSIVKVKETDNGYSLEVTIEYAESAINSLYSLGKAVGKYKLTSIIIGSKEVPKWKQFIIS
jgi:hypothetical protein